MKEIFLNIKIHRGTKEIGGSCVEISTPVTRIIIDLGLPLVDKAGGDFNFSRYEGLSVNELIKIGILPDLPELYSNSDDKIDALLLSHPHADHFGLINFVRKGIPVYLSKQSNDILDINSIFTKTKIRIKNPFYFESNKPFSVGDFTITPYFNDHSSFISYSFLIEANNKKIIYSGDFRGHGRKAKSFYWFLKNAPENIDALLMEGTNIGRDGHNLTEQDLEKSFIGTFKEKNKINLILTSSQNIDRLVTIYRACKRTGKLLVMDFYTATVLKILSKYAAIPYPSSKFPEIRVFYPYFLSRRIANEGKQELLYQFKKYKITKMEIDENYDSIVMLVRPSMLKDLKLINSLNYGNVIYSQWEGYLSKDQKLADFITFLLSKNMKLIKLHTSGHSDVSTLKKYVNAVKPKYLIPIHTDKPEAYKKIFSVPIINTMDGQLITI